ncbi:MAG: hypothetical protein ACM31N_03010 [Deltaproteobacteria bacterium]
MDFIFTKAASKNEDAAGLTTESKSDSFIQRYSLTLDKRIFPNLGVVAGGLFERNALITELEGRENNIADTKMRPFIILNLRTPLYQAEGGYSRTEQEVKTSTTTPLTTVRQTYFATLGWRPDGFPETFFRYFHTDTFDKERRINDGTDDSFQLTANYQPVKSVSLRYGGAINKNRNNLQNIESRNTSHEGSVTYSESWWKNRISISSNYYIFHSDTEFSKGGSGEVSFPLSPVAGLSSINDTPLLITLDSNPALIDGDFAAGTGINLGLPPPSGDSRPRSMGLDFFLDTQVNSLLVWVDRDIPQDIAGTFSWEVYTSEDNRTWNLHRAVFPAVFGPFVTRFQIDFDTVTTRYIKVVTRPLSSAVPFANNFPNILVTELQATLRRQAADINPKVVRTNHRYNFNARAKLLKNQNLYYELSYFLLKNSSLPSAYDLSNGLSFNREFGRIFSGFARVSREDSKDQTGEQQLGYTYTASISATPLQTLHHSVVYTGQTRESGQEKNETNSITFVNSAHLYDGVDANIGAGGSVQKSSTAAKIETIQLNAGLTLVPHRTMTVNLAYFESDTMRTLGGNSDETTDKQRTGGISVTYNPLRTLYIFGSLQRTRSTSLGNSTNTTTWNYSANWSPFPDGTLNLNFNYNETIHTEDNSRERRIIPSLRWNIGGNRGRYVDLSYQYLNNDAPSQKNKNEVVSTNLHLAF